MHGRVAPALLWVGQQQPDAASGGVLMTTRELCESGNHEVLKGGVHGAAAAVAAVMAGYNIAAWCLRRDRHLGFNSVLYTLAFAWEVKQTLHHLAACESNDASPEVVSKPAA